MWFGEHSAPETKSITLNLLYMTSSEKKKFFVHNTYFHWFLLIVAEALKVIDLMSLKPRQKFQDVFIFLAYFTLYNVQWENPEESGGEGGGRGDRDGEYM